MSALLYADFIARRSSRVKPDGRKITTTDLHPSLMPFQAEIVVWAAQVGCPAVWADTGLGKTRMQLEWCRVMGETALVMTTLAVAMQTIEEAAKIGIDARYVRSSGDFTGPGIYVTNYEMLDHFDPASLDAFALDESSILKQSDGKTRTKLIEHFSGVAYRSAWSATPGPNDPEELTNQAEFLGHMTRTNMLAAYFVHDQDGWRLKGHAIAPMIAWMSTWAMAIRKPSDLGYDDDGYILPGLRILPELVDVEIEAADDELFAATIGGVSGRSKVRKQSLAARVERTVQRVNEEPSESWLLWCGLNDEAETLAAAIPGAVNVHGSMTPEQKAEHLLAFAHGDLKVLITKPKIASMGLNFQAAARMAFVGLSDSYEAYYQCIRRQYRYGQKRVVHAHVVLSHIEEQIIGNVLRKEKQANKLMDAMVQYRRNAS